MNKTEYDPARVYLLPNLMTAGNLFCGFMAVLYIFQGTITRTTEGGDPTLWVQQYQSAVLFILGAFAFDMLDGRLARLGGQESAFGREFDSLADVISFGIAPALLVYKIVLSELREFGLGIAFIYLACGAMRLARFNVHAATSESGASREFTGFPIPAAAGLVASLTLALLKVYEGDHAIGNWKFLLAVMLVFLSFMMFSKYRYPSFKKIDWRTRKSIPTVLVCILVIALMVLYYRYGLAIAFTSYLLYGFFRPHLSYAWRKYLEVHNADEEPEGEENGSGEPPQTPPAK